MPHALLVLRRIFDRARPYLLVATLIADIYILLVATNGHEPVANWIFWKYAGIWLWTLVFGISCLSAGHALLGVLPGLRLRVRERLLFDFAVGVLAFGTGIFLAGIFCLLRGPFYYLFPAVLTAAGAPSLVPYLMRAFRHVRGFPRPTASFSVLRVGAAVVGTLGITLVYLCVMTPDNLAFDAQTYHIPIAEHYGVAHCIRAFPEGSFSGALPHLASWLYTWAFTITPSDEFFRLELVAHLEFLLFLATLASLPLLVEVLVPGKRAGMSWVVFFLFPGLFLYDSSLGGAADHVLAFWAVPLALAAARVLRGWSAGRCVLLGLMIAGGALTKYQALSLLIPVALFLLVGTVRAIPQHRGRILKFLASGPGLVAVVALLATVSHWLANLIWHGNPVYPLLGKLFPSRPWVPGWQGLIPVADWRPTGTLIERLRETSIAAFKFSFVPHDWYPFHHDVPVFGFLFTLSLPLLLFVRRSGRTWLLATGAMIGVFVWYWTYHQDRYLQALLPWMVASTSATLALAWSSNLVARIGVAALVGLQLVWGGDVPFLPTHAMIRDVVFRPTIELLSASFRKDTNALTTHTGYEAIAAYLPANAVVLVHEEYLRLGIRRKVVGDSQFYQGAIDYAYLGSPGAVFDQLASFGVTHLLWRQSGSLYREITVAGELVFFDFTLRYSRNRKNFGDISVAEMPERRPPDRPALMVAHLGCRAQRLLPLNEVNASVAADSEGRRSGEMSASDADKLVSEADVVVADLRCPLGASLTGFVPAPRWGDLYLWVRSR
ncbi:MAG: hypothetical protein WBP56_15890 [Polyangia bacterium]